MYMNKLLAIFIVSMLAFTSCTVKEIQPPVVQPPVQPPPKPAKIALVLGAGSSKGFAHIGVLKILESNKIPIHMIVGTSVGSAVGSLYAYGIDAFSLQKLAIAVSQGDIVDSVIIPSNGFIKGEKLEEFINKSVKNTPMEKLKDSFLCRGHRPGERPGDRIRKGEYRNGREGELFYPGHLQACKNF